MAYKSIMDTTGCEICRDYPKITEKWGTRLCPNCQYQLTTKGIIPKYEEKQVKWTTGKTPK